MRILGIESSCDESAVAIFDPKIGVLESLIHSQIDLHALYGGVVPDLASSEHLKKLPALISKISKSEHFKGVDMIKLAVVPSVNLPGSPLSLKYSAPVAVGAALAGFS